MSIAPRLRHLSRNDGLRLAYTVWGAGLPLVRPPAWLSHQGFFGQHPEERHLAHALAALVPSWMEVAYDQQGTGLSDRRRTDFTLTGMVSELEAVLEELRLPRVALLCKSVAGLVGVAYAAQHPERVSGLILVNAAARGSSFTISRLLAAVTALTALEPADWELGAEALAQLFFAGGTAGVSRSVPRAQHETGASDMVLALWTAYCRFDVAAFLPSVAVPTLVIHSRGDRLVPLAAGVELATCIPGAHFLLVDGRTHAPLRGAEAPFVRRAILEFLLEDVSVPLTAVPAANLPLSPAGITQQQLRVLRLIAQGRSSHEIATELVLSERTVQRHIANLYAKVGVHNRAEATAFALHLAQA